MPRFPMLDMMFRMLGHVGWVSALFMSAPPVEPVEPVEQPPGREKCSGTPMSPAERAIWADLLK